MRRGGKRITNKKEIKDLDIAWTKKVKDRDNWTCQICKKKVSGHNCQAHHILPKTIKLTRWDINNGITLCYQHHKVGKFSAHMNAIWFTFWLKTNKLSQFRHIINKLKELEDEERNSNSNS
jgi:hypothetical protein